MNSKKHTLPAQAAAALIADALGDSPANWAAKLGNWRRPERRSLSPLSWSLPPGRPKYDPEEVAVFIESQKKTMGALALRSADPADNLPVGKAAHVTDKDARHMVQVTWEDRNASGVLALSVTAAQVLLEHLARAIASARTGLDQDFNTTAQMAERELKLRIAATGPDGELPTLSEALRRGRSG